MNIIIYLVIFLLIFILSEILKRKFGLVSEITRKISHVLSGIITMSFPYFLENFWQVLVLVFVNVLLFSLTKRTSIFSGIQKIKRKSYGEIYFPIGIGVSAMAFYVFNELDVYLLIISIVTFSDTVAEIVGKKYSHTLGKSFVGSVGFFVTSVILVFVFLGSQILFGLAIAIATTIVEFFSKKGSDNATIPLVAIIILISFHLLLV